MDPVRIAMWAGPRTCSTALLRSWESRADTVVVDEPLYAAYLAETGLDHPGRDDILASQSTDWRRVATALVDEPLEAGATIAYQKHMAHHLLPSMDRRCFAGLRHAFLLRDPRQVLASYAQVRAEPTAADLGIAQQLQLFETFGGPVVDSADLLRDPPTVLRALCAALDVPFDVAMLTWRAGPRDSDGVWAPHWYDAVIASTGFGSPTEPRELPERLRPIADAVMPAYDRLARHRLGAA